MADLLQPRPDQLDVVAELKDALRKHQSALLHAQCGWGKTVASAFMAKGAQAKRKRVIFAVHRKELVRQTARTFEGFGIEFGYIAGGYRPDPFARVQIATRQTLSRYPELVRGCDLFVPDEAHLWGSKEGAALIDIARESGHVVPLTATPQQGNGRGLAHIADTMVHGPSVKWLIGKSLLARYRLCIADNPNFTGLHIQNGDYIAREVDDKFGKPAVIGSRVEAYREFAMGKRHIGYCYSRENGQKTADSFNAAGIAAAFIDGETPDDERRRVISAYANGDILALLNCQLFREGFDLSAQVGRTVPIQSVGLYAPTTSLPLAIQEMMRPLRPQDEPAVIIDHVNIIRDHGLPDDDREWSLDGRVINHRMSVSAKPSTRCDACFRTFKPFITCPGCGVKRTVDGRFVKEVAGQMIEVDIEAIRRAREMEVKRARTLPDLIKVAKAQGRQAGWVYHLMKARGDKPDWRTIERAMKA